MTLSPPADAQTLSFVIPGPPSVNVTISEMGDGTLLVDLSVDESEGLTADIRGLFFDVTDTAILDGMMANGQDVTGSEFEAESVDNLGQGVNMNGDGDGKVEDYDAGVRIGTSGIVKDDIQTTQFLLSHDSLALYLEDIEGMDFGVRLTSVGEIDGSRDGSLKLGTTAPELYPDEPEDPVDPPVDPEPEIPDEPPLELEPETPDEPPLEPEPETPDAPPLEPEPETPDEPPLEPEPETPVEPPLEPEPETPDEPPLDTGTGAGDGTETGTEDWIIAPLPVIPDGPMDGDMPDEEDPLHGGDLLF